MLLLTLEISKLLRLLTVLQSIHTSLSEESDEDTVGSECAISTLVLDADSTLSLAVMDASVATEGVIAVCVTVVVTVLSSVLGTDIGGGAVEAE